MIDINDIYDVFQEAGSTFYKIEDLREAKKTGNYIFEHHDIDAEGSPIDNGDPTAALQQLELDLSRLKDGKYVLRHYKMDRHKSKGHHKVSFQKGEPAPSPFARKQASVGGYGQNAMIGELGGIGAVLQEKIDLAMLRKENEELKARNEELEDENGDPTGLKSGIGMLTNAITATPGGDKLFQMIIAGVMGKVAGAFSPGFAGTVVQQDVDNTNPLPFGEGQGEDKKEPTTNQEPEVNIPEDKLTEVNQWLEANGEEITGVAAELYLLDNDCISLLKKVIAKEKASPGTISMVKNFL